MMLRVSPLLRLLFYCFGHLCSHRGQRQGAFKHQATNEGDCWRRRLAQGGTAFFLGIVLALGMSTPSFAFDTSTCVWRGPYQLNTPGNDIFIDSNVVYWSAQFTIPAGARVVLNGQYPHGRYISFVSYNSTTSSSTGSSMADVNIAPDADGSINPFIAGNVRNSAWRNYTLTILPGTTPSGGGAANTLYSGTTDNTVIMLYRLYLPDTGQDITGGVGLPAVSVVNADSSTTTGTAVCASLQPSSSLITMAPQTLLTYPPLQLLGIDTNPGTWSGLRIATLALQTQVYANPGNNYVETRLDRGSGTVAIVTGKLPNVPHTLGGDLVMGTGDMRYWSLCSYEFGSYKAAGCLSDQQVTTDSNGYYTIAVSRAADKPSNATSTCGKNWLQWSDAGNGLSGLLANPNDGMIMLRNLLQNPSFTQGISNLPLPLDIIGLPSPMGDYLPTVTYTSKAGFEAMGGC